MTKFTSNALRFAYKATVIGVAALLCGYGFAWATGQEWTLPVVVLAVGVSLMNQTK